MKLKLWLASGCLVFFIVWFITVPGNKADIVEPVSVKSEVVAAVVESVQPVNNKVSGGVIEIHPETASGVTNLNPDIDENQKKSEISKKVGLAGHKEPVYVDKQPGLTNLAPMAMVATTQPSPDKGVLHKDLSATVPVARSVASVSSEPQASATSLDGKAALKYMGVTVNPATSVASVAFSSDIDANTLHGLTIFDARQKPVNCVWTLDVNRSFASCSVPAGSYAVVVSTTLKSKTGAHLAVEQKDFFTMPPKA